MTVLTTIEKKGTEAVKRLRVLKLRNGHPFMINSMELNTSQCYLEYPDGSIKVAEVLPRSRELNIIRVLNESEANGIRQRYRLVRI